MSDSPAKSLPEKTSGAATNNSALVPALQDNSAKALPGEPAKSLPAIANSEASKNLPENNKSNNLPSVAKTSIPATATAITPTNSTQNLNDSKKADFNTSPEPQFTTDKIGQWASKQENPFAEQNRRRQAKKQAGDDRLHKATPYIFGGGMVVLGVALTACIIGLTKSFHPPVVLYVPEDGGGKDSGIIEYRNALQAYFNSKTGINEKQKIEDVNQMVQETLDTKSGKEYSNQVKYAQMNFYLVNGYPEEAIKIAETIDPDELSERMRFLYYNELANSYYEAGEIDLANRYYNIADNLPGGITDDI